MKAATLLALLVPAAGVFAQVPTEMPSGIPTEMPSISPEQINSLSSYFNEHSSELSQWAESAMSALPSDMRNSVSSEIAKATNSAAQAGKGDSGAMSTTANKVTVGVAVAGSAFLAAAVGMLV